MTQCEKVLDFIKTNGSITTFDAYSKLRITRLPSRIHDLRSQGVPIEGKFETKKRKVDGNTEYVSYMRYSLGSQ